MPQEGVNAGRKRTAKRATTSRTQEGGAKAMRGVNMTGERKSAYQWTKVLAAICAMAFVLSGVSPLAAKEKKSAAPQTAATTDPNKPPDPNDVTMKFFLEHMDVSKIVWPNPPAIARIRYMSQFYGEKREEQQPQQKKSSWMDRLSGVAAGQQQANEKLFFQLVRPYGVGVDSHGKIYVADEKVLAVFIYNPEDQKVELIKNGQHARFKLITGVTLDDADQLFVSDSVMKHVLVFDKNHKLVSSISQGMSSPAGMAVDNENRFLYVCDTDLDQVLVYDADPPYKLLRKMGTSTGKHDLNSEGDFSRPTNVAVDKDGNLYVSDTFNNRVEVFDADGNFIRAFGKSGDGPGYFARPKGITIDSDGHVWIADAMQDRVQVFTPEGRLLIWMGGHGALPGQFDVIAGLTFDGKRNRVITSEQYPGRVQIFRYVTNEEAKAEKAERDAQASKKPAGQAAPTTREAQARPAAAETTPK
jgi:DNA-binding beta-propeller fold protein YncE